MIYKNETNTIRIFTLGKPGEGPIQETTVGANGQVRNTPPSPPPYKVKVSDGPHGVDVSGENCTITLSESEKLSVDCP